jgi:hypothetical protein
MRERGAKRLLWIVAGAILSCSPQARLGDANQTAIRPADAAYASLIALQPAGIAADARGDGDGGNRIATAVWQLLLLLDQDNSDAALEKLVALSHFDLGTAPTEVYDCVVIRKSALIVPLIQHELREPGDPCITEFGQGSVICRPWDETAEALRSFLSAIAKQEPCEIP